jgi:hypothetical protein
MTNIQKEGSMKLAIVALALCLAASNSFAVSGRSVSTFHRAEGTPKPPEAGLPGNNNSNSHYNVGAIVRYDIVNNKVVRCDTIVKMSTAMCQYPMLSLDGSRVAFFRWPYRAVNNTLQAIAGDSPRISVVDISGKNLKDLVTLPTIPGSTSCLDWAADGTIAYAYPRADCPQNADYQECRSGDEIWTVNAYNANPASTNHRVLQIPSCEYVHRFAVTLALDRYSLMNYGLGNATCSMGGAHGVYYCWNAQTSANTLGSFGGCNTKVSCSGAIAFGFCSTPHTLCCGGSWTGSKYQELPGSTDQYWQTHTNAILASSWAGFPMGSNAGVDLYEWSANSDKWYSLELCWVYNCWTAGGNQLLVNWINQQAIMTTRNPIASSLDQGCWPLSGATSVNASDGDFWVQPPSAQYDYAWEDTSGVWHQMTKPAGWTLGDTGAITRVDERGGMAESAHGITVLLTAASELYVGFPDAQPYAVAIVDMRGRTVGARSARARAVFDAHMLHAGLYVIRASRPGSLLTSTFTVVK